MLLALAAHTWVVLGVLSMELLGKLLVRVRLDAQRLVDRKNLEQEWQLVLIALCDFGGQKSLVLLDEIEESSLGLEVFGRERGVSAHP